MREAKRTDLSYRQHALGVLSKCLDFYVEDQLFAKDVLALVQPLMEDAIDRDAEAMDIDAATDGTMIGSSRYAMLASAISCVFKWIRPTAMTDDDEMPHVTGALDLVRKAQPIPATEVQYALCDEVTLLCRRMQSVMARTGPMAVNADILETLTGLISPLEQGASTERTKRAEAGLALAEVLAALGKARYLNASRLLREELLKAQQQERDRSIRGILDDALSR